MCPKCDARFLFGDGPCNQCQVKSASKPYFKGENKNEKPYYIRLLEYGGFY